MRHIKHEKECFSRIKTPRSRMGEQGQVDLYFHPINETWNSRILSGRIQVIEIAFQNLRRTQTS